MKTPHKECGIVREAWSSKQRLDHATRRGVATNTVTTAPGRAAILGSDPNGTKLSISVAPFLVES